MPTVELEYDPRPHQLEIHRNLKRFNVLVCHRRFGKSVLCINQLIAAALRCKNERPRYAYIAPFYRQAKSISWDYLKHYCRPIPGVSFNESELRVDLPNGARITLYGADNYDALRGIYLDGVVLDEYAQMSPKAWTEVIRPALSDRMGWAVFIGTPKGHNHFHDLYQQAQNDPEWYAGVFRASDTNIIPLRELEAARRAMSEDEFAQEFECNWEAAIPGSYFAQQIRDARDQNRIIELPFDKDLRVYTFWDIGMRDAMAVWFGQIRGEWIDLFDYEERTGEGLPFWASLLEDKARERKFRYASHFAPHDIVVREIGTGKSRLEVAESLGINFEVVPRVEDKMDSIQTARLVFPKVRIHSKLTYAIDCLTQYHKKYDEERKVFSSKPEHDFTSHCADAFQTMAMSVDRLAISPLPSYDPDTYDEETYTVRLG